MSVTYREENNVGIIELDQSDSKVNILSFDTLKALDQILDQLKENSSLDALVFLSKKKDIFIAGADIKEIEKIAEIKEAQEKAKVGQDLFNKLEDLKIPSVAVIDGAALGGGCELALACLYRIATFNEKVKIGLPEVLLGIVPGFGGTYRLPRVVGLSEGLKMILSGRPIDGQKALKIGLVDQLFPQKGLIEFVQKYVSLIKEGVIKKKKYDKKKKKGLIGFLERHRLFHPIIYSQAKKNVLKETKGFYPAPLKAIEVVRKNFYTTRKRGLAIEAKAFGECAITEISKNLIKVFYLSERFKKLTVEGGDPIKPKKIRKVGIVGAGVMGGGIAQLFSYKGILARMKDINHEALGSGFKAAAAIYKKAVQRRKLNLAEAQNLMGHITGTLDYSGFKTVDIIMEAVVEEMEVKKQVFKELSEVTGDEVILATNTSALSVTEMAREVKDPSKVIGLHFFNPVHRMPLVEIITTPMTSKETMVTTVELAKHLNKIPIIVRDSSGFIVNRILLCYISEAGRILEECGDVERIDRVIMRFGMPMGPLTLADEVGLDVGLKVMHILEESLGDRYKPVDIFERFFDKGQFGKKTRVGFYIHGKKRTANPQIEQLLPQKEGQDISDDEIEKRLIFTMINEAARCLQENIVDEPDPIDVGMIFGTGFPAFRGGLLCYADAIGIGKIIEGLDRLSDSHKSDRFKPCIFLTDLKSRGRKFFN